MKTSNIQQGRAHPEAIIRGWVSKKRAGSTGIVVGDGTLTVDEVIRIIIDGGTVVDNGDGTITIIIGGAAGGGAGSDGTSSAPVLMLNNSGTDLGAGAVVVVDESEDNAVTTTETAGDTRIVGVVAEPIAAGEIGPVTFNGYAAEIDTVGTVARGEYLQTSTTAGSAETTADREAGSFAVVTAGQGIAEFATDYAVTEQDTAVTSLSITMPDSVIDSTATGQLLFLGLWRDPSVTSSPTITGWTRVGSTSGFWYYTRICAGGDTASATWTGSTPAAAIVLVLDERVAVGDPIEDFDYDSTTSAAAVAGLSGLNHYAVAAVASTPTTPTGWTSLAATAVLTVSGGSATDVLLGVTVTQDPANTGNWVDPTNVNDGNTGSFTWKGPDSPPHSHLLVADLGSAVAVSTMWAQITDGGSDQLSTPDYSDDGSTWTAISGSWGPKVSHNGTQMRQFTITGAPITHRYFRAGKVQSVGNHGQLTWTVWEIVGTTDLTTSGSLVGTYIGEDTTATSPFTGTSAQNDAIFVFNVNDPPKASALLYGPDLGSSASSAITYLTTTGGEGHVTDTEADCGASFALDLDSYNAFDLTLTEACTFSFTSTTAVAGQRHTWAIGLRGDFDVTWPVSVVWRDTDGSETATPPAMSGAFNAVEINTLDGGTTFGAVLDNGGGAAATSSPLTTKGDLWGFDTADNRVPVGTDGYPLVASSAAALGVAYTTLAAAAYPFHAEPLCDSSGPILEASGDVIMVIGVPN